jgi:hypothetical protein
LFTHRQSLGSDKLNALLHSPNVIADDAQSSGLMVQGSGANYKKKKKEKKEKQGKRRKKREEKEREKERRKRKGRRRD